MGISGMSALSAYWRDEMFTGGFTQSGLFGGGGVSHSISFGAGMIRQLSLKDRIQDFVKMYDVYSHEGRMNRIKEIQGQLKREIQNLGFKNL